MSTKLNITHRGQLIANTDSPRFLVNNFTQSGTTTQWSFGGTSSLANGVVTLTGVNPGISCTSFTVNAQDIVCFEFTVAVPTPSTTTSGPGLHLGTTYGQSVYVHSFNMSTHTWSAASSTTTNPYFLGAYNSTAVLYAKCYILGSAVNLSNVPWGDTNSASYAPKAIQLTGSTTSTALRSGYNSNTSMVITFFNPRIYNINQSGYYEANAVTRAKFGNNWVNSFEFMEY